MNKRTILYVICTLLFLTGCWDVEQADDITYVSAIGLDEAKDGKVKLTYLIVNPDYETQPNASADSQPFNYVSFLADDFFIAKNIINTLVSEDISYVILNNIFVSEALAKKDKFVHWIYDTTKDPEIRRDLYLAVTKEKAENYLKKFNPQLEEKPFKYFREKTKINNKTGLIPFNPEIFFYFRITEADNDLFMTTYTAHGSNTHQSRSSDTYTLEDIQLEGDIDDTQYLGAAVFKQGRMIGSMTGMETMLASMLHINSPGKKYYLRTFSNPFDEDYSVSTRMNVVKRSKVKMDLKKSTPTIHVTLPITIDVLTNHAMVDYEKSKNRKKLKKHIRDELTRDYEILIKKTQEEFGSDPFGWSILGRKHFYTTENWEKFNWMKKYSKMDINIDVHIKLAEFGRQSEVFDKEKLKE